MWKLGKELLLWSYHYLHPGFHPRRHADSSFVETTNEYSEENWYQRDVRNWHCVRAYPISHLNIRNDVTCQLIS
jgi:hypothetical protein